LHQLSFWKYINKKLFAVHYFEPDPSLDYNVQIYDNFLGRVVMYQQYSLLSAELLTLIGTKHKIKYSSNDSAKEHFFQLLLNFE
jgi:hypothetical protein